MDAPGDFDAVIDRYHEAAAEFVKGNPAPYVTFWSEQDDVTIANPWGPPIRGWASVRPTVERAATNWHDGEVVAFENISKILTPELAYIVEIERFIAKMGDSQEMVPVALRTTTVLRPEDGTWKIIHRHADSITTARAGESVIQK